MYTLFSCIYTHHIRLRLDREVLLLLFSARVRSCPAVAVDVSSTGGGETADVGGCGLVGVSSGLLLPDEVGWLGEPGSLGLASSMLQRYVYRTSVNIAYTCTYTYYI